VPETADCVLAVGMGKGSKGGGAFCVGMAL
jgi:hypothetical protein